MKSDLFMIQWKAIYSFSKDSCIFLKNFLHTIYSIVAFIETKKLPKKARRPTILDFVYLLRR